MDEHLTTRPQIQVTLNQEGFREMQVHFEGTPSDDCPAILKTGKTDSRLIFMSLSQRHAQGLDAEYLVWHSLDHRPEQYRIAGLRHSIRVVSTPACRDARAASVPEFDAVDHVIAYLFTGPASIPPFHELFVALCDNGRFEPKLPPVGFVVGDCAGRVAAPRVVVGADVVPWRPLLGAYLLIEEGSATLGDLADTPGVAGAWWFDGIDCPAPFQGSSKGRQIAVLFLDEDPVAVAQELRPKLDSRWAGGAVSGLLAAPFHAVVPFDWSRHLP